MSCSPSVVVLVLVVLVVVLLFVVLVVVLLFVVLLFVVLLFVVLLVFGFLRAFAPEYAASVMWRLSQHWHPK